MARDPEAADTRMMGIVHAALRRDLERVRLAATTEPFPRGDQGWGTRRARGVADGLPARPPRGRGPRALAAGEGQEPRRGGSLLDLLESDHERVDPLATALSTAGHRYAESNADEARVALVESIDALAVVLFPHLDREVDEAMPVVSAAITRSGVG